MNHKKTEASLGFFALPCVVTFIVLSDHVHRSARLCRRSP